MKAAAPIREHTSDFVTSLADGFSSIARKKIKAVIIDYVIDFRVRFSCPGRAIIEENSARW
ncbi:hypothetical protein ASD67_10725 [Sphingopyxis sp. Root1497]|nr:hypothetical protein ASD67_10725 [Sphingopyxis sp. Root1497]